MDLKGNLFHSKLFDFGHRRRRKRLIKVALFTVLGIFVLGVITLLAASPFLIKAQLIYKEANRGKNAIEAAETAALALDFEKAGIQLARAEESFLLAREGMDDFSLFRGWPWVGNQIRALDQLLLTSIETTSAVSDMVHLGEDMIEVVKSAALLSGQVALPDNAVSFGEISREEKRRILKTLFEASPLLQGAKAKIDLALASFQSIPENKIAGPLKLVMKPLQEKLPELREVIAESIPAAELLPQLLGYPEPKTYLFLLENNSELRPTGGFIGTYGIVKLDSGDLVTFATDNIYKLDAPAEKILTEAPPAPIQKYIEVQKWFLRDANWSPDFPTSARKAEALYLQEIAPHIRNFNPADPWYATVEPKVHGVIAMTPEVMRDILRLVGEVRIEDQVFTPDNLVDVLEYQVGKAFYDKDIPEIQRKEVIGKLAEEVKNRLFRLPATEWPKVMNIIRTSFNEKNLLVYDKSPQLQELIRQNNWDGSLIDTDGDYLMVVDANMASLKTDQEMERKVEYTMTQKGDEMRAKATITYKNNGVFTWKTTRYRTYTRLFVPKGSELISAEGIMENDKIKDPSRKKGSVDVSEELGKTVFGAFVSVEPGETRSITLEYRLPEGVRELYKQGIYNLYVQKQPGVGAPSLTVGVDFDKTVKNWLPRVTGKTTSSNKGMRFETNLREDRAMGVRF